MRNPGVIHMRRSSLRLYGPFLAIALVQALFILAAPSDSPDRSAITAGGSFGDGGSGFSDGDSGFDSGQPSFDSNGDATIDTSGTGTNTFSSGSGGATSPSGQSGSSGSASPSRPSGSGTPNAGGTSPTSTPAGGTPTTGAPVGAQGDTSHCAGALQFDVLLDNPPCRAKWPAGADNGGATYQGVTKDKVRVVFFAAESNPAVDAVLAPQGLAATPEELNTFYANFEAFFKKRYESYGRELELIRYTGACPTSPPDVPSCKEAAREVIKMKPFMVSWGTPLYGEVFDEFARAGIVSVGGWHFDNSYFTQRRPFRYDIFMDGTRSMELSAEYYCKKMAGKTASHAGRIIHRSFPSGGQRDLIPRKVAIITPEIDANLRTAEHLRDLIRKCDGHTPVIATYESDIEKAQAQTEATTAKLIEEQVTTAIHIGDPVAPAFSTAGFTAQEYFPEYWIAGVQLLDYDLLGRLYDKNQMAHAFGLGHLAEPVPFSESNAARMYRDVGSSQQACGSCNLPMGYVTFVASVIHGTGPNLNPATVENYLLNASPYGGDRKGTQLIKYGPDDYTGISDAREIYWSETQVSTIDGKPGAYISPNNAARYQLGQLKPGLDSIPVPPR